MRGGGYLISLAGVAVLAAGCGTQVAGGSGHTDALAAAVARTSAQTARVAITTTTQMQSMSVSFTETGVFDFAHSRGMLSMQQPVGLTELFVPPKTYVKLSDMAGAGLPRGKSWFAISDGMPGGPAAAMLGPFGGNGDPADLLASLTAVAGSEKEVGTTVIRGVPVTEYQVNIDPAKAVTRLPGWERAGFQEFVKALGSGAIPVDVWVDSQDLVRRVQLSLHVPDVAGMPSAPATTGNPQLVQSADFYDFGVPVRVAAPPASEVASMPQIIGGQKGTISSVVFAGGPVNPPKVTGTLTPAQSAAAEQAVAAFWAALGRNDPAAVVQTVLPSQRSCVTSGLDGAPHMTVSSFRAVSAEPAGDGRATVRFTVNAKASVGGQDFPVLPPGGGSPWFVAAESGGNWYVDLAASDDFPFTGPC